MLLTIRTSSMLQQFVRTADLEKVYAAVNKVLADEKPASWKLKAYKYYYIPSPPVGLAGIVVEPTPDLLRLQQKIIDAVTPFTVKTGTPAAFMSTENGRDIQNALISYVANFVQIGSGKKFNPHVTIGVAAIPYLKKMLTEPFEAFHVPARGSFGLPTWCFWYGAQGTQGFGAGALSSAGIRFICKVR